MFISIYLVVAIVCAIVLIIMAIFGNVFGDVDLDADSGVEFDFGEGDVGYGDFGGPGISPLSVPILLIFGTFFGLSLIHI